jgi:lysozyme
MRINKAGLELIKSFEGLRLEPYFCSAGVLTVGYGHTGKDVKAGERISLLEAEKLLEADLKRFEAGVTILIGDAPTTSNQFSALVSFAFNLGLRSLEKSTLLKRHKAGDIKGASEQFLAWNKARVNGQLIPLKGLTRRRCAEARLYKGEVV